MARRSKAKRSRRRNPEVNMSGYNRAHAQLLREIQIQIKDVEGFISELKDEPKDPDVGTLLGKMERTLAKLEAIEEILEE